MALSSHMRLCLCACVCVCECGAPAAGRDFAYLLWQPHADECVQCRGGSGFNFLIIFRCKIASPVYPALSPLPSHTTHSNNSGNNCKQFMRLGLDNFRLNDMQAPWRRASNSAIVVGQLKNRSQILCSQANAEQTV